MTGPYDERASGASGSSHRAGRKVTLTRGRAEGTLTPLTRTFHLSPRRCHLYSGPVSSLMCPSASDVIGLRQDGTVQKHKAVPRHWEPEIEKYEAPAFTD
ncbi:hypothetical protein SKAU_G00079440 [Synaphobranchus kaupii]|uniref:Uncharacterized protein n=1 Tax=Synaphobranchus kaupii TaxID=118154 RepID=A0A9Q1FUK5_SYNKA|nr:hypothetical protein SKAU_G00079440 [Synaphobranchus kaupii]